MLRLRDKEQRWLLFGSLAFRAASGGQRVKKAENRGKFPQVQSDRKRPERKNASPLSHSFFASFGNEATTEATTGCVAADGRAS